MYSKKFSRRDDAGSSDRRRSSKSDGPKRPYTKSTDKPYGKSRSYKPDSPGGSRPFVKRDSNSSDRPFRKREDGEKRYTRERSSDGGRSYSKETNPVNRFKKREGDDSGKRFFRKDDAGSERKFTPRNDDRREGGDTERKFVKRDDDRGERKFTRRDDAGSDRKFVKRDDEGGERKFTRRDDSGSERKFTPRDENRGEGGDTERKFVKRDDDRGERKFTRRDDSGSERKFTPRDETRGEGGDTERKFVKRDDDRGERKFTRRDDSSSERKFTKRDDDRGERKFTRRDEAGSERKFTPRDDDRKEGGDGERKFVKRDDDRGERKFTRRDDNSGRSFTKRDDAGSEKTYTRRDDAGNREGDGSERKFVKRSPGAFRPRDEKSTGRSYIRREGDEIKRDGDEAASGDSDKSTSWERKQADEFEEGRSRPDRKSASFSRPYEKKAYKPSGFNPKKKYSDKKTSEEDDHMIRLNRYLSNAGICSRREADELIETGVITVNGVIVTELGSKVDPDKDEVRYNGEKVRREKLVYILMNKPKDYIATVDDPQERKTVMQLAQRLTKERVYPVGRLDRNTTGVLLLTNDGDLTMKLTHPKYGISKVYAVELDKKLKQTDLEKIEGGITLEDGDIKVDVVTYIENMDKNHIGVQLHSGRNRIVRRIFESLGYEVVKLDRAGFAGLSKKGLKRGESRFLTELELAGLKKQVSK